MLTQRAHSFLCALLMLTILPTLAASAQTQPERIDIWSGTSVHHRVWLTLSPAGANSTAVIVCPGGSYFWHDMDAEGEQAGSWLQRHGISAFVLRYRTAYVPAFVLHYRWLLRGNRYPDALNDLRQSLRYVRSHAKEYGVDTTRIGVMGFSAGGHLAMSAVELLPRTEWPKFVVPVYPVVTFVDPCMHKRSRRGLLGDSREHNRRLCDSLSMERHVPEIVLRYFSSTATTTPSSIITMPSSSTQRSLPAMCRTNIFSTAPAATASGRRKSRAQQSAVNGRLPSSSGCKNSSAAMKVWKFVRKRILGRVFAPTTFHRVRRHMSSIELFRKLTKNGL